MEKVILITGASSGIGEALAKEWSHRGSVILVLAARNRERLEKVRTECESLGAKVLVVEMDLSNPLSIEKAVAEITAKTPAVDIVVHNGGISQRSMVKDTKPDVYRRLMEVNFLGAAHLTQLLLPKMLERKSGHFVVISSIMGKIGTPWRAGYAASKHALHGFFDCLRSEVCHDGLSVTMVCPGFVKTPITYSSLTGDGSTYNKMGEVHNTAMNPEVFAKRMIAAVDAKKQEVYIAGKREMLGIYLKRFCPWLLNRIVSKAKVI